MRDRPDPETLGKWNDRVSSVEDALTGEQMKGMSRRLYVEVFGAGNLDAADQILAPECMSHGAGTPPELGVDPIKRQATTLREAVPDLLVTLEDHLAEGHRVASRGPFRARTTGGADTRI